MYSIDGRDEVVERTDVPQSSVGAPLPVVVSDEWTLLLAYLLEGAPVGSDDSGMTMVTPNSADERVALVRFEHYDAYMFGPPNDEAFAGHPLARRGLQPYGVFEVERSSWLRRLERMNAVHPHHNPARYERLKHYIFAFHDSTFECIAEGFTVTVHDGPLTRVLRNMQQLLGW